VRRAALVLLTLALAGCGSAEEKPAKPTTDADSAQVRALATRYLDAFGRLDLEAMCATLSPRTRRRLSRRAGSCARAFRGLRPTQVRYLKYLLPNQVRVRGDRATVTVTPNGRGDDVALTLEAVKLRERWWIELRQ
jgi:hypothetical protein